SVHVNNLHTSSPMVVVDGVEEAQLALKSSSPLLPSGSFTVTDTVRYPTLNMSPSTIFAAVSAHKNVTQDVVTTAPIT
ncbi:hypothetical protein, partial [Pseudomonas lurida]|uniref:hypothetical protein n=1 Tax=Pseudomonas lurida TaxID=244566 RepID=UPI0034D984F6